MNSERDFWAKGIATSQVETPVTFLREQAALLGPKTNHLVEARVRTNPGPGGKGLVHSFELLVPTLDRYTYQLFSLYHEVEPLYPITVVDGPIPEHNRPFQEALALATEDDLKNYMRLALSSEKTTRIINNLISQARAA